MQTSYLGKPFVYPPKSSIGKRLGRGEEWDWFLRTVLLALVKEKEPTICEVGSNIGASLMQILAAKPRARVLAFEPADHFRSHLLRNIELAGASDRVRVYPNLVGREPGTEKLYYGFSTASAIGVRNYRGRGHRLWGEQVVGMITLDAVLAGERVHFIKVDVDGLDFEVLRGAENALKAWKPSLHFEFATFLIPEPVQNLAWLQGLGYKRLLCLTQRGKPIGITEDPSEAAKWAQDIGYCDIVTCPEGSEAEARLLSRKLLLTLRAQALRHQMAQLPAQLKMSTYRLAGRKAARLRRKAARLRRKAARLRRKAARLRRKAVRLRRKAARSARKLTRLRRRITHRLIAKLRGVSRL